MLNVHFYQSVLNRLLVRLESKAQKENSAEVKAATNKFPLARGEFTQRDKRPETYIKRQLDQKFLQRKKDPYVDQI